MEFTEIAKLRREVLTRLSKYTFEDSLVDRVYEILYQVVTEDTPRYRCCVHKERAVLKNRICMALGLTPGINIIEASKIALKEPLDRTLPVIDVLPEACNQCPVEKYMVTDVCRHCLNHKCMNGCPKQAISIHQNRAYIDHNKCIECGKCMRACPYGAIIEITRPCERACALDAIHPGTNKKANIDKSICVDCGSCRNACPFGAIDERSCIVQLITDIKNGKKVHALLAPSFVTQFGVRTTPGQIAAAFKAMGFAGVREVAEGADLVVLAEAEEFIQKVPAEHSFMTNSCCPAFVELVHKHVPEFTQNVSTTVSPMVACGRLVKREDPEAVTVFVGPCIAKKVEARKYPEDIDYVLTYEEAACMMAGAGVEPDKMPEEPFISAATERGNSFPLEAGVSRAVSAAVAALGGPRVHSRYCSGLSNCLAALRDMSDDELSSINEIGGNNYVEGMACLHGCIDGPGTLSEYGLTRVFLKKFAEKSELRESPESEEAQKNFKLANPGE